ncbi:MAG TPA: WhiB family transcriptional regulator [Acidimicrobiales bacterium]|nr:WhiB family transcriptional regulator [Acidimicrobiales bacterium]
MDNDCSVNGEIAADAGSSWTAKARCRDLPPAIFFPSDGLGVTVACRYCAECPVREPCLEYALQHRIEHGVWGGASERERGRIARGRRASAIANSLTS